MRITNIGTAKRLKLEERAIWKINPAIPSPNYIRTDLSEKYLVLGGVLNVFGTLKKNSEGDLIVSNSSEIRFIVTQMTKPELC